MRDNHDITTQDIVYSMRAMEAMIIQYLNTPDNEL